MRRPNILDVVRAVTEVAPAHPEVTVWWFAPDSELAVRSDRSREPTLEIVVETATTEPNLEGVASKLSDRLSGTPVTVRTHRGREEDKRLFRMLTNR